MVTFYRFLLISAIAALLLSAVSCGTESDMEGGAAEIGTHQLFEGFFMDDIFPSNDPFPQPSNDSDAPVITDVRWDPDPLRPFSHYMLIVEVESPYPVTSMHIRAGDDHYVFPTDLYEAPRISFDICEISEELLGAPCTTRCLGLASSLQRCQGADQYTQGTDLSGTEFIQQLFAATCSQAIHYGVIGPNEHYRNEYDYFNKFWLGNDEYMQQGYLSALGVSCNLSDSNSYITSSGNRAERVQAPAFPQPDPPFVCDGCGMGIVVSTEKPARSGSASTLNSNMAPADLGCVARERASGAMRSC